MRKARFTENQIIDVIKSVEAGRTPYAKRLPQNITAAPCRPAFRHAVRYGG